MMKIILTLLALSILSGCGFVSIFRIQNAYQEEHLEEHSFKEEIPFIEVKGVIIIQLSINGINRNFGFDTGSITLIDDNLVDEFNLKKLGYQKVSSSNNKKQKLKYATLKKLEIGTVPFSSIVTCVADIEHISNSMCLEISGIIGANIMNKCVWQIDYDRHMITLTNDIENLDFSKDKQTIDFYSEGKGTPIVNLYSNGKYVCEAQIDTGSNGGISLSRNIALDKNSFIEKQSFSTGIFGSSVHKQKIIRAQDLSIGSHFSLDSPIVTFNPELSFELVGTQFLRNYRFTIDWPHQKIVLDQPTSRPFHAHNNHGFSTTFLEDRVIVGAIYTNSTVFNEGLRLNDVILSINGTNMDGISREDYCQYLSLGKSLSENSIELVIKRETEKITFTVYMSNLIKDL